MYGCELEDDGTKRAYKQFGYDGEDFISLDLKTGTWTAANAKAVITKNKWDPDAGYTNYWRNTYLQNVCIEWLQKYVGYGRDTLERKATHSHTHTHTHTVCFISKTLVCHATGFFPKAVMISWQKNGEDLNEGVELRETVPNQDGTFQKRSILNVSPEELKNNQYTCVVQHSSLEKEKVLKVSDRVLHSGGSTGVIIGVVVAVLLLAVIAGVGFFIRKRNERKNRGDALETSSARSKFL
uniref:Major histocompatibility complex class I UBA n=1 Tax=Astyanax mexicanus TaxID=7994 RepID=A0A3B1IKR1_ASTMX